MNTYHAFYKGKQIELEAETSYKAQLAAAVLFNVKAGKSYTVNVVLVGIAGKQVTHSTAGI
jgi:hypothetical protein